MTMSDTELRNISTLVYSQCGIVLTEAKKSVAVARLGKRVRNLGLSSFREYIDFIRSPQGVKEELTPLIDAITTNTTGFFREKKHFAFLQAEALPSLESTNMSSTQRPLNFWSAGCSTGEEPYTLAMVLSEYFRGDNSAYSIMATDISTRVLARAQQGVYPAEEMSAVPIRYRRKYLMREMRSQDGVFRIVPELRDRVTFGRLNLIDEEFPLPCRMDVIFCRNVILYFDVRTRKKLMAKLYDCLHPGGYLFTGNSESLSGLNEEFVAVAPTIYRKPGLRP